MKAPCFSNVGMRQGGSAQRLAHSGRFSNDPWDTPHPGATGNERAHSRLGLGSSTMSPYIEGMGRGISDTRTWISGESQDSVVDSGAKSKGPPSSEQPEDGATSPPSGHIVYHTQLTQFHLLSPLSAKELHQGLAAGSLAPAGALGVGMGWGS